MTFNESNKAIYLQIADKISEDVLSGRFGPDSRIPSVRECSADFQVNANTVMRSYEYLQNIGVIYNKRGIGFFISPDARTKILQQLKASFFGHDINLFFRQLQNLEVKPEELARLYSEYLESQ